MSTRAFVPSSHMPLSKGCQILVPNKLCSTLHRSHRVACLRMVGLLPLIRRPTGLRRYGQTALQMFLAKMLCLPFSTNGKEVDQRTTSSSRSMTANAAIRILAHLMYVGESITASAGTALPGNRVPSLTSPNSAEARKRMSTFTVDILLRTQHSRHSRV